MTNIVMLARDRPRLTEQTLRTLYMHTPMGGFNLAIVNDHSQSETIRVCAEYSARKANAHMVTFAPVSIGIVGFLRNVGARTSERVFGRGDYLCFIDNDIAFLPNWLGIMSSAKEQVKWSEREDSKGYTLLGGYRHPFHGVNHVSYPETSAIRVEETDAVAGYMHFMTWDTWDKYGPYDSHAKGVCQSEDFAFSQKIIHGGGHVGYVNPSVIANCGITNSEGKPAVGSESFPRIKGLLYE